jgi:uncharacterized protein YdbL (DUF1318 family)
MVLNRLGSVVLAAVLLGVPRALDAGTFGAQPSVYLAVATMDPRLRDFVGELERAIRASALTLAAQPSEATMIVELLGVSRFEAEGGRPMEAARFVVHDGPATRPVILHYAPGQGARAARRLLERLPASGPGLPLADHEGQWEWT